MEVRSSDTEPLEVRLKRLEPGLRAFVRMRIGRLARVEADSDVKQSVFRRLFGRVAHYERMGDDQLRTCLHRLAHEVMADHLRYHERLKRRGPHGGLDRAVDTLAAPRTLEPVAELERQDQLRAVTAALEGMPELSRLVVRWFVFEGLGHAEIGRRLGRSEDAAKMLYHRSIAALARSLRPRNQG